MHNERGHILSSLGDTAGVRTEMRHKTSPLLDDFQRKGERGSKTVISENRADLNFIIFRRTTAVAGPGLSPGIKGTVGEQVSGLHEATSKVPG